MIRYKSSRQLSISEFKMPFEAKLDENNRWVILSKIVPWEEFARLYYKSCQSYQPTLPGATWNAWRGS
jgi:IS5 family transposase